MKSNHIYRRIGLLIFVTIVSVPLLGFSRHAANIEGIQDGARITEIRIDKSEHQLALLSGKTILKRYRVGLGPGGLGPKQFQGDNTTPTGTYRVSGRIKGLFHQFLIVSYPNEEDRKRYAELKARGVVPKGRGIGHSIGIHGGGSDTDWTLGCIAVENNEIDEIAARVPDGTKIVITD